MWGSMKIAAAAASSALIAIAPAGAQYPVYGYSYGGSEYPYSYGASRQIAVNRCSQAVQERLSGNGYGGAYGDGGRVLGISRVEPYGYGGGVTVHGVASSGRYSGYGYGASMPVDLTWRCTADYRGFVVGVSITPAQRTYGGAYGYQQMPYEGYDYSQYGYRRY